MEVRIFEELMQLNQKAFGDGHYDKASHLLTAALFCARSEASKEHCIVVEDTAMTQSHMVDEQAPEYQHSSFSASKRCICREGLFNMLAKEAHVAASSFI